MVEQGLQSKAEVIYIMAELFPIDSKDDRALLLVPMLLKRSTLVIGTSCTVHKRTNKLRKFAHGVRNMYDTVGRTNSVPINTVPRR